MRHGRVDVREVLVAFGLATVADGLRVRFSTGGDSSSTYVGRLESDSTIELSVVSVDG